MTERNNKGIRVLKDSLKSFHRKEIWFCSNDVDSISFFFRINGIVRSPRIEECPFAGYWVRVTGFPGGDLFSLTNRMLFGNYRGRLLLLDESIIEDARMAGIMTNRHFLTRNPSANRPSRKSLGEMRSIRK